MALSKMCRAVATNLRLLPNAALVVCGVVAEYGSRAHLDGIEARTRVRATSGPITAVPPRSFWQRVD